MIATETDKMIIRIALEILRQEELLTMEKIRDTVHEIMEMLCEMKQLSDVENAVEDRIIREIETLCDVYFSTIPTVDVTHSRQE